MDMIKDSLKRYRDHRIPTGSFLERVLCNDFMGACQRADDFNRHRLFDIAQIIYDELPIGAYGSEENYRAWLRGDHLKGEDE